MTGLRLTALAMALCCALTAGCATKNSNWQPYTGGPIVTVVMPDAMVGDAEASWTVRWPVNSPPLNPTDPCAPYTISMDMGGGAMTNVTAGTPAKAPFTQTFTMVNPRTTEPATYTYIVIVTNSQGLAGTSTGTYIVGPSPNHPPVIESAVYAKETKNLVVTVSDPDDSDTLTVDVTVPAGLAVDETTKISSAAGPLIASFVWSQADFIAGGSGTSTVTVTDAAGDSSSTDIAIDCSVRWYAGDSLYAYPSSTSVAVGEPVTVIVLTTIPANPFHCLNGVGLTIDSDAQLVGNSFDVGSIGGLAGEPDGFWSAMMPSDFFAGDNFYVATDIGGGRERWDFNVTPVGGSDLTTSDGALFNVQFTFSTPGVKNFGFQQVDTSTVKRTFYSDLAGNEYFWGDISNEQDHSVTVY